MQVGVEDTPDQHLVENAPEQQVGQLMPLAVGKSRQLLARSPQRDAVEPLQHQHGAVGELGVHGRHPRTFFLAATRSHGQHVVRLDEIVQLVAQGRRKPLHDGDDADRARPRGRVLQSLGESGGDVQVGAHLRASEGFLDLEHHLLARQKPRAVHLRDGGDGERFDVDGGEHLLRRAGEGGAHHRLQLGPGQRGRIGLQTAQLARERRSDDVGPAGQHLTDLDEGDPAVVQGGPQCAGREGPPVLRHRLVRVPRPSEEAAESVTGGDAQHVEVAPGPAILLPQAAYPADGCADTPRRDDQLQQHQQGDPEEERPGHHEHVDDREDDQVGPGPPRVQDADPGLQPGQRGGRGDSHQQSHHDRARPADRDSQHTPGGGGDRGRDQDEGEHSHDAEHRWPPGELRPVVDGSSDTLDNGVGWTTHIDPRRGICRCFSGPQGSRRPLRHRLVWLLRSTVPWPVSRLASPR